MSEPIVFVSTHRIKEGKLAEFKEFSQAGAGAIEKEKPGTVAFLSYLNEDGTEVSFVHVFPDAPAMAHHLVGVEERAGRSYEFLEPQRFEIYGRPSEQILETMRQSAASAGAALSLKPDHSAGYLRLRPE